MKIAILGQAGFGGLYLGCAENNKDEIWIYNADSDAKLIYVAKDIFSFCLLLKFSRDFSNFEGDYSRYIKIGKKIFGVLGNRSPR